jgi:hypothetical protein
MRALLNTVVETEDRVKLGNFFIRLAQGPCFMELVEISLRAQPTHRHVLKHRGVNDAVPNRRMIVKKVKLSL